MTASGCPVQGAHLHRCGPDTTSPPTLPGHVPQTEPSNVGGLLKGLASPPELLVGGDVGSPPTRAVLSSGLPPVFARRAASTAALPVLSAANAPRSTLP